MVEDLEFENGELRKETHSHAAIVSVRLKPDPTQAFPRDSVIPFFILNSQF